MLMLAAAVVYALAAAPGIPAVDGAALSLQEADPLAARSPAPTPTSWEATVLNGTIRVQALSPRLIRVEPVGPAGFEDRPTFLVTNRTALSGVPLAKLNESRQGAFLATAHWIMQVLADAGQRVCRPAQQRTIAQDCVPTDPSVPIDQGKYITVASPAACAALCQSAGVVCVGWNYVHVSNTTGLCYLLSGWSGIAVDNTSTHGTCGLQPAFVVRTLDGSTVLYDSRAGAAGPGKDTPGADNLLLWPSPLAQPAYALVDFPRFTVPEWGATPLPPERKAGLDPAVLGTNGYDFRNNQDGDTYLFLLGADLDGWHAARHEFNALSGQTPLLPDFAWGTWFDLWHNYSYAEATAEVLRWERDKLPLDVYGLNMNWRNVTQGNPETGNAGPTGATGNPERYYNRPNTTLFSNYTQWFEFLKEEGLATYFNDHPYQMDMQLSEKEVAFRWQGLTSWLDKGLGFWWFDPNWGISVGPPFVNTSSTSGDWMGLDNAAWGSHLYYTIAQVHAQQRGTGARPMVLTKYANKEPWRVCGWASQPCDTNEYPPNPGPLAESPAQRRYPVPPPTNTT